MHNSTERSSELDAMLTIFVLLFPSDSSIKQHNATATSTRLFFCSRNLFHIFLANLHVRVCACVPTTPNTLTCMDTFCVMRSCKPFEPLESLVPYTNSSYTREYAWNISQLNQINISPCEFAYRLAVVCMSNNTYTCKLQF